VVNIRLTGKVNLGRVQIDGDLLSASLCKDSEVTAVAIDSSGINLEGRACGNSGGPDSLSRDELERFALKSLIGEDLLWNLHEADDQFVDLFMSLKESVRSGKSADEHAEMIRVSPLVAKVRQALAVQAGPVSGAVGVTSGMPPPEFGAMGGES
jgi:hypothetical protein